MKIKKALALTMAATMTVSLAGCSSSKSDGTAATAADSATAATTASEDNTASDGTATTAAASDGTLSYAGVTLGTTGTDITTTIKVLTQRTDMLEDDYTGTTYAQYIAEFNKMYPNITVNVEGITNYADDTLVRLTSGDWGDVMMIPAVDKSDLSTYFVPYGTLDEMNSQVRFASEWSYDGEVYGVASTGNAQGIVYNKKVFSDAGITALPTTPEDFIADLQLIKDNTDAIPLYTNYAAEWTMGAWDAYLGGTATGDADYMNSKLTKISDPFANYGDDTHAYAVYKILYDAVANKLTEDDYTTTDWEGCKGMINNGQIGCMVLGSWAYTQMRDAGDHGDDIGYFSFPITVNGKQYASAGPDYNFGINVSSSDDNKLASMIFVKWMTEDSKFSYNEGGIPIAADDNDFPELYSAFDGITYVSNNPAPAGEETLLNSLNVDSELNINNGGNTKVMEIVEHASSGDETFDDIMADWNSKWADAQKTEGVDAQTHDQVQ